MTLRSLAHTIDLQFQRQGKSLRSLLEPGGSLFSANDGQLDLKNDFIKDLILVLFKLIKDPKEKHKLLANLLGLPD